MKCGKLNFDGIDIRSAIGHFITPNYMINATEPVDVCWLSLAVRYVNYVFAVCWFVVCMFHYFEHYTKFTKKTTLA